MTRRTITALAIALCLAKVAAAQDTPAFAQGQADRAALESWLGQQAGEAHDGAIYWSAQRSLPHPGSCYAPGGASRGAYTEGCVEAQRRLAPADARRHTEPDYRAGWNSWQPAPLPAASDDPTARERPGSSSASRYRSVPMPAAQQDSESGISDVLRGLAVIAVCVLALLGIARWLFGGRRQNAGRSHDNRRLWRGWLQPAERDFLIDYVDVEGVRTQRPITVLRLDLANVGMIQAPAAVQAWCHRAGAERTFRVDRIEAITDLRTGASGKYPRLTLLAFTAERRALLHHNRDKYAIPPDFDRQAIGQVVPRRLLVIARRRRGGDTVELHVSHIIVTPDGLAAALRGRNQVTGRAGVWALADLLTMADGETGEVVEVHQAQAWLHAMLSDRRDDDDNVITLRV